LAVIWNLWVVAKIGCQSFCPFREVPPSGFPTIFLFEMPETFLAGRRLIYGGELVSVRLRYADIFFLELWHAWHV
jgi:hypothetical protein